MTRIVVGVGVVTFRGGDVLLIRRGKPPFEGRWSIPGGRLEYDEALRDAALRELREETGVEARLIGLIDVFEALPRDVGGDGHLVMIDYAAEWVAGDPVAGDDAADARFVPMAEAVGLVAWDETRRALAMAVRLRADVGPI